MLYSSSYVLEKQNIMNKSTTIFGIDISKDTFDVWNQVLGHKKFSNDLKGFKEFKKWLSDSPWCVMEYTGSYYQQLAMFLYKNGISLSVVNPLVIKRFIQMKFQHNKTDKSDSRLIALYGTEQRLKPWEPNPDYIEQCKALHTTIALYFKQSTALKNKVHSFESRGTSRVIVQSLNRQLKQLRDEIKRLEAEIELLIKENEPDMLSNLLSIPGIGKKTAMMLISSSNAFRSFENHKQLSAFYGLSPSEHTSGSSVKGKSRITKKGNPYIRNHLFMCSFTASEHNQACKALYTRIVNKGKSKKLALIAVCNKLLKQSFAIATSGVPYNQEYRSRLQMQ